MEHPNLNRWWNHRRKMAYISLFGVVGLGVASIFVAFTSAQAEVVKAIIYTFGFVIGAYIGASTWDDVTRGNKP